ncbi:hypothetical protein [Novosphingobium jiangmenense]|uniref:Late embryogenesis abundant protein n=1 Tax=Novosphingobium jiangmenense TaxID=2791981 RepID=A0ABS0HER7_9SPHN|nr:hypothetical protein [Novosphingobium jiangmenense]MBF9150754.1 hypothetical protein [Novosphingobium jiangmenense]
MKAIFKGAMMASVLAMGFGLSACDSGKENAAEDQADAVRQASDAAADTMENKADAMGGASEDALENKADAVRETGEKKADAMEDQADKMDKTPG